jgi:type I restriction enzyme R subunit
MSDQFAESVVEDAALQWLSELGFAVKHGPHIAPGELHAERTGFGETVLEVHLRNAHTALRDALLPKLLSGEVLVKTSV